MLTPVYCLLSLLLLHFNLLRCRAPRYFCAAVQKCEYKSKQIRFTECLVDVYFKCAFFLLLQFLSAVMLKDYETALKYCKLSESRFDLRCLNIIKTHKTRNKTWNAKHRRFFFFCLKVFHKTCRKTFLINLKRKSQSCV